MQSTVKIQNYLIYQLKIKISDSHSP